VLSNVFAGANLYCGGSEERAFLNFLNAFGMLRQQSSRDLVTAEVWWRGSDACVALPELAGRGVHP